MLKMFVFDVLEVTVDYIANNGKCKGIFKGSAVGGKYSRKVLSEWVGTIPF